MVNNNSTNTNSFFARVRNKLYPLFWFIASSNEKILRESPTNEQDKHFGYGMAILLTAVAAVVSGFFAFSQIIRYSDGTPKVIPALLVAILWGFLILNLDRIMVGSMKKDAQNRRRKELLPVLPRILLAAVIALVISKPIEVELLKMQIVADQVKNRGAEIASTLAAHDAAIGVKKSEVSEAKIAIEKLEKERQGITKQQGYLNLKSQYETCSSEAAKISQSITDNSVLLKSLGSNDAYSYWDVTQDSNGVTNRVRKFNDEGRRERDRLRSLISNQSQELKSLNCSRLQKQLLNYLESENKKIDAAKTTEETTVSAGSKWISIKQNERDTIEDENEAVLVDADTDFFGLLDDLGTLKENNSNVRWASVLLALLFFILEIAPIFVKWICDRGIYDELLEADENLIRNDIRLKTSESQIQLQSTIANGEAYLNADTRANQELLAKVMAAQGEIGKEIVEEWKNSELEKLRYNREAYLKDHIVQS